MSTLRKAPASNLHWMQICQFSSVNFMNPSLISSCGEALAASLQLLWTARDGVLCARALLGLVVLVLHAIAFLIFITSSLWLGLLFLKALVCSSVHKSNYRRGQEPNRP